MDMISHLAKGYRYDINILFYVEIWDMIYVPNLGIFNTTAFFNIGFEVNCLSSIQGN